MSTVSQLPVTVVDTTSALLNLLGKVASLDPYRPSIFMDLEGVKLGRYGSLSIISLFIPPAKTVYLVDIYHLGNTAFSTTNAGDVSLKTVLESTIIPKVVFDVRNDSDALYSLYRISVGGIIDLQLMELASRRGSKAFVAGLTKCIENDSTVPPAAKAEWRRTKEAGTRLFAPEKGGQYEVFNKRPIKPEIVQYCAQDVALLQGLHEVYETRLRPGTQAFWRSEVEKATRERIEFSQSISYDPQGRDKARGPWDDDYIRQAKSAYEDDSDEDYWYEDSARDCIGWEEDMIKNGEPF